MTIRKFTRADFDRTLATWNRSAPYDQMTPELFEEKLYEDQDFSENLTLVAEEDKLAGFIMGVRRRQGDQVTGYVKLLAVDPAYRRKRIGSELLQRLEQELQQSGAKSIRVFESSPNYLVPGIDPRSTETVVFFERRGYERCGDTANMEVELVERSFDTVADEKQLAEQGYEIRRAIMGDRDEINRLLSRHWRAWIPEVERALSNYPISLHVAIKQEKIVAFSAYDGNNRNTGWFGPMGTDPQHRGRKLGEVLLKRCLADIQQQRRRMAIIPWVGPYAFYSHHVGARISRVFWRYRKTLS